ncbi:MAG: hypothetical protein NT069_32320 [Planctomycetota bacterium]|nr:hypothetical protein [Planctomycetota bacterium]
MEITVQDERPKWQKQYWQGAETPRDYELAVTFIPLEKFRPLPHEGTSVSLGDRLGFDEAGRNANYGEITTALARELDQANFIPLKTVLHLKSFILVVNKQDAFREVWDDLAEARREALVDWRRNSTVRAVVGMSTGVAAGLATSPFGAGVMVGSSADIPALPGETPLARTYGAVTGPPTELGDYGPDVTCVIETELELYIDRNEPRRIQLSSISRSLPLLPPHFLTEEAVPATMRQALLQLVENAREQFAEIDRE